VGDTNLISGLSKTRIEALTDGIFAIAMTLMVFDIKVAPVAHMDQWNLRHELIQLWPRFLAYVISFVMLGVYWVGHHNQYHYIRRTDRPFLWINIFFLMGVSLIPFSTSLLRAISRGPHRIGSLWPESNHGRRISLRPLVIRRAR